MLMVLGQSLGFHGVWPIELVEIYGLATAMSLLGATAGTLCNGL